MIIPVNSSMDGLKCSRDKRFSVKFLSKMQEAGRKVSIVFGCKLLHAELRVLCLSAAGSKVKVAAKAIE